MRSLKAIARSGNTPGRTSQKLRVLFHRISIKNKNYENKGE